MNRYELHTALKTAREEGRDEGYKKGLKDGGTLHVPSSGHPLPRAAGGAGKPKLVASFIKAEDRDAYELRAVLYVGDKYYYAVEAIGRETIQRLVADHRDFQRNVNIWVEGATQALLKEFAKDIEYVSPKYIEE